VALEEQAHEARRYGRAQALLGPQGPQGVFMPSEVPVPFVPASGMRPVPIEQAANEINTSLGLFAPPTGPM
jgi:hypothetical protein